MTTTKLALFSSGGHAQRMLFRTTLILDFKNKKQ
jgi:hypothetical protein